MLEESLKRALRGIKYEPEENLADDVWRAITLRSRRVARLKIFVYSFFGLASFFGLIPVIGTLSSDLSRSGFYEYLSLLFSDSGSVISYWKEFMFSLAQSLPVLSIISSLALVFVFLFSVRYLIRQTGSGHLSLLFRA